MAKKKDKERERMKKKEQKRKEERRKGVMEGQARSHRDRPHNLREKFRHSHHRKLERGYDSGSYGMVESKAPTVKHSICPSQTHM